VCEPGTVLTPTGPNEGSYIMAKLPDIYTSEELHRLLLLGSVGDHRSSVRARDHFLLRTLASTGLRISEALSLVRSDIDLPNYKLFVSQGRSKTGPGRWVYFGLDYAQDLESYLDSIPPDQAVLFATSSGLPVRDSHIRGLLKKIARRAGIPPERVHAHKFRHTYAVRYLEAGGSLPTLSEQLGHADIQSTLVYLHVASWHRAQEAQRLNL